MEALKPLGLAMAQRLMDVLGGADRIVAYGKSAVVGENGELEHAALCTSRRLRHGAVDGEIRRHRPLDQEGRRAGDRGRRADRPCPRRLCAEPLRFDRMRHPRCAPGERDRLDPVDVDRARIYDRAGGLRDADVKARTGCAEAGFRLSIRRFAATQGEAWVRWPKTSLIPSRRGAPYRGTPPGPPYIPALSPAASIPATAATRRCPSIAADPDRADDLVAVLDQHAARHRDQPPLGGAHQRVHEMRPFRRPSRRAVAKTGPCRPRPPPCRWRPAGGARRPARPRA